MTNNRREIVRKWLFTGNWVLADEAFSVEEQDEIIEDVILYAQFITQKRRWEAMMAELTEMFKTRPEIRELFLAVKGATKEQIEATVRLFDAFRQNK